MKTNLLQHSAKFCDSRGDIIPTPSNSVLKNGKLRQKHLSQRHTAFECLHRVTIYFRASINSLIRLFNFAVIIAWKKGFVNSILKFLRIYLFFTDIRPVFVQYHNMRLRHYYKNVTIMRYFYTLWQKFKNIALPYGKNRRNVLK